MQQLRVGIAGLIGLLGLLVASASAAPTQEGLVNVNISDVTVQIPVAVAANICDVDVNVLANNLQSGATECRSGAIALADNDGSDGSAPQQEGLINVNISDVTAQVPVAVAADVCGVAVNVLASLLRDGPVDCTAFGQDAAVSR
jgi:hypothetical protein